MGQTRSIQSPQDVENFEKQYDFPVPIFLRESFETALLEAKRTEKMLLVYLHCKNHDDTDIFCSDTLSNPALLEYLAGRAVVWMGDISRMDGYARSHQLRATSFPFLAALAVVDAASASPLKPHVLWRHQGLITIDTLISQLSIHDDAQHALRAQEMERIAATFDNRNLRAQQDSEYQQLVEADKQALLAREAAEEAKRAAQKAEEDAALLSERTAQFQSKMQQQLEAEQARLRQMLPEEPEERNSQAATVAVRLLSGVRINRRFLLSASVRDVRRLVESQAESIGLHLVALPTAQYRQIQQEVGLDAQSLPEPPIAGSYDLVTMHPRCVHASPDAKLSDLRLGRKILFYVELPLGVAGPSSPAPEALPSFNRTYSLNDADLSSHVDRSSPPLERAMSST